MDEYQRARLVSMANRWWFDSLSTKAKKDIWMKRHYFGVYKEGPYGKHIINAWWRSLSNDDKINIYLGIEREA